MFWVTKYCRSCKIANVRAYIQKEQFSAGFAMAQGCDGMKKTGWGGFAFWESGGFVQGAAET